MGVAVHTPGDGRSYYLPWAHKGGGNLDKSLVQRWLQHELRGKRIANLNTRFDIHMLRADGTDLRAQDNTFRDVAHSEALLDDHNKDFSLDGIGHKRCGIGKLEAGPKEGIADLHAGLVAPYAIRDVELVAAIQRAQTPLLAAEHLGRVQALEDAVIPVVVEMEANGVPLNMPLLEAWNVASQRIQEKIAWDLWRACGFQVNPDSPKAMERLFNQCHEPFPRTPTGKPSFPGPTVQDAAERHQAIRLAWRLGKLIDLRNKYLVKYLHDQHNGVLYPTFHQLLFDDGEHGIKGTVSGRFSCVRPNMQQVLNKDKHRRVYGWLLEYGPDGFFIMDLLVAAEGRHVFGADAKQIEYRIFADYSESPRLLARYAENPLTDFHNIVQEDMLRRVRPDVNRTETKAVNFLSIFGGKGGAIARTLNIPRNEADDLERQYHEAFPEAKLLINRATAAADTRGWVKTRWGRRCRFQIIEIERTDFFTGRTYRKKVADRGHKALNAIVQGTAADYNKATLVDVYAERHTLGLTMRATVHDYLNADIEHPALATQVERLLNVQRMDSKVPILWECGVGHSWGAAK